MCMIPHLQITIWKNNPAFKRNVLHSFTELFQREVE
jgi:hypothetical protein